MMQINGCSQIFRGDRYHSHYPDYVSVEDYMSYDVEVEKLDVVYIQNPYDDDNFTFSVNPYFYAKNLKKHAKELVYIPCFYEEEISDGYERAYKAMNQYVISPGVVYADRVILQSEQMKDAYVRKLVEYFGEDTRKIWERKIEGISYVSVEDKESKYAAIPAEWERFIFKEDGSAKKVILYHISVCGLIEYKDKMLEKIKSTLETFKKNSGEITIVWYGDSLIDKTLPVIDGVLYEKYLSLVDGFKTERLGIYYDGVDEDKLLLLIDAYYGDIDRIIQQCRMRKIPVMIQDVEA